MSWAGRARAIWCGACCRCGRRRLSYLASAFLKWNGRPFILALEHGFYYFVRTKLYLWNNEQKSRRKAQGARRKEGAMQQAQTYIPKLSESKLRELAWSLDIKERIAGGIQQQGEHVGGVVAPMHTAKEARI